MVVGQLLDDECPEDFIKGLILSVRSLLPVEPLVDECEKRYDHKLPAIFIATFAVCILIVDVLQESPSFTYSVLGASCE